jgi:hypothetical protein
MLVPLYRDRTDAKVLTEKAKNFIGLPSLLVIEVSLLLVILIYLLVCLIYLLILICLLGDSKLCSKCKRIFEDIFNRTKDISKSLRWVVCLSQWFITLPVRPGKYEYFPLFCQPWRLRQRSVICLFQVCISIYFRGGQYVPQVSILFISNNWFLCKNVFTDLVVY